MSTQLNSQTPVPHSQTQPMADSPITDLFDWPTDETLPEAVRVFRKMGGCLISKGEDEGLTKVRCWFYLNETKYPCLRHGEHSRTGYIYLFKKISIKCYGDFTILFPLFVLHILHSFHNIEYNWSRPSTLFTGTMVVPPIIYFFLYVYLFSI